MKVRKFKFGHKERVWLSLFSAAEVSLRNFGQSLLVLVKKIEKVHLGFVFFLILYLLIVRVLNKEIVYRFPIISTA